MATALAVPVAVVAAWQLSVSAGVLRLRFLPAPDRVAAALIAEVRHGELLADLGHTLAVAVPATAVAAGLGGALGAALGLVAGLRVWTAASVDVLRAVPAIALMPAVLLLLGPRWGSELVLASFAAVWPVVLTTAAGVAAVPEQLRDVARVLHLSRAETFRSVVLPAAVPHWLAGVRTSAIVALHVTVIAEMIIAPTGLGGALVESLHALNPPRLWAYALTCGAVGHLLHAALRRTVRAAWTGAEVRVAPARWPARGLLPLTGLLLAWQLLAADGSRALPPPEGWLAGLVELSAGARLPVALAETLATAAAGLAGAALAGVALGLLVGSSRTAERLLGPGLDFTASVPGAATVPLAVLLLGPGRAAAALVVALAVVWPVLLSTAAAVRTIPPVRLDAARTLGLGPWDRRRLVVLPSVVPGTVLGIRVAATQALIVTLLVETIGTGDGLGRLLVERQQQFDAAGAWGLVLLLGTVGYLVSVALDRLARRVVAASGPPGGGHPA